MFQKQFWAEAQNLVVHILYSFKCSQKEKLFY